MRAFERLLEYVKIPSAANEKCAECPSSPGIWEMGRALEKEMRGLGLSEVELDGNCYLTATLPANTEGAPVLGFVAHMDVSPASPCEGVNPRVVTNYDGGNIVLDKARGVVTKAADFPALARYKGKDNVAAVAANIRSGGADKWGPVPMPPFSQLSVADAATLAKYVLSR